MLFLYQKFARTLIFFFCFQIFLSFPKGATTFDLLEDGGILVGPSALKASELVLQAHYLVPPRFEQNYEPVWDTSGFRITLEKVNKTRKKQNQKEREPLSFFVLNDYGLNYPQGHTNYSHSYDVEWRALEDTCRGDFEEFGSIQPVAAHFHAHATTTTMWVDHINAEGKKIGEYGRIEDYEGHSTDQDYFFLPEEDQKRPLLPGDSLRVHCVVDTSEAPHDILFGVGVNTEMCETTFVYKNHNPSNPNNFVDSNLISICTDWARCGISEDIMIYYSNQGWFTGGVEANS